MNYIGRCLNNFKEFYSEINAATLTGAIDVVIVEQRDGTFLTSPFHVRFGKIGVLKSKEKVVDIEINGVPVDIHMKLGESGEAFFVTPLQAGESLSSSQMATSPIPASVWPHDRRSSSPTDATTLLAGEGHSDADESVFGCSGVADGEELSEPSGESIVVVEDSEPLLDSTASGPDHSCQFKPIAAGDKLRVKQKRRQKRRRPPNGHHRSFSDSRTLIQALTHVGAELSATPQPQVTTRPSLPLPPPSALSQQPECHPFSDTEMSRPNSRFCSRSASPVKSDTEFEVERERASVAADERGSLARASWTWGQLPVPQSLSSADASGNTTTTDDVSESSRTAGTYEAGSPTASEDGSAVEQQLEQHEDASSRSGIGRQSQQQSSMLAGMFSFMRSTRRVRHDPLSEGVYLDDLDLQSLDPEVAALYFPRAHVLRPAGVGSGSGGSSFLEEVGRRASSTRGARVSSSMEDDEGHGSSAASSPPPPVSLSCDVALSLCADGDSNLEAITDLQFARHQVSYEQFAADPVGLLQRPQMVVRVDGRMLHWSVAAPILCSLAAFGRQLPSARLRHQSDEQYTSQQPVSGEDESHASIINSAPPSSQSSVSSTTVPSTVAAKKTSTGYSSWFSWRRQSGTSESSTAEAAASPQSAVTSDLESTPSLTSEATSAPESTTPLTSTATFAPESATSLTSTATSASESTTPLTSTATSAPELTTPLTSTATSAPELTTPLTSVATSAPESTTSLTSTATSNPESTTLLTSTGTSNPESTTPLSSAANSDAESIITETGPSVTPDTIMESADSELLAASESAPNARTMLAVTVSADQQSEETCISQPTSSNDEEKCGETPPAVCTGRMDSDTVHTTCVSESDDVLSELNFDLSQQVYKKSLRLTSEQVSRLGLRPGRNEAQFSVTTAYQGTTKCHCGIFLWRYDDKVVISDIDGTITKSDVLGHLLPMIGQHWAQSGVTSLFTKIQDNGFKFLYLSARAIGQAPITREYLRSVKQGNVCLPEGPLLLSPSSLVSALHREVIERRPEDFKIPCLKDIAALFPGRNPLYAGFGNRVNDALSYHAVDIPYSRIFTINHRGELRHELTRAFQSSYTNLSDLVDHFFPFSMNTDTVDAQEFNDLAFWRVSPADCDLPPVD